MANTALIAGVGGIVGNNLARHLLAEGWAVHGLARHPPIDIEDLSAVKADLTDPTTLAALAELRPTHVFITTWRDKPPRPKTSG